eukprot:GFKZ01009526.1.p1 GENE.GFKZ01009526.1~~GFKZ01009526.1.p1  ORF type:complete len:325 (-),score=42.31 GFKZ01009526.1:153-1127(-)
MGKGGINRLLLTSDDISPDSSHAVILAEDPRAASIRALLYNTSTLRVAVEQDFTHDAAPTRIEPDGNILITLPESSRAPARAPPPVLLIIAMQRPRAMARILDFAAQLGVACILIVAAEKVEKSYWDSKLFRVERGTWEPNGETNSGEANAKVSTLPGRPRGEQCHPERDVLESSHSVLARVDMLPRVRRNLKEGIVQAATDASLPMVFVHRLGILQAATSEHVDWGTMHASRKGWRRLVLHPLEREGGGGLGCVTKEVERAEGGGVVVAIGPEGGWTEEEVQGLEGLGFCRVELGERVLRSETAVVVSLGLVHEGLRRRGGGN